MLPDSFTPEFLRQLELVKIRSRKQFLGSRQGGHISPKRGHGIEFADFRKYELGDNPRHIDWGVYARSDRLYVKKYQEEQDLNIYLIIDGSASMFTPLEDGKWQIACEIAIALAYVALMEQDSVTVLSPGLLMSPSYYGGRAIHELSRTLLAVRPSAPIDFVKAFKQLSGRVRFPGVAIVLSDFLMPLSSIREIFNALRSRNMDITAVQLLGPNDLDPLKDLDNARVIDSETGEELEVNLSAEARQDYNYFLEQHNKKLEEYFSGAQINYVSSRSDQPLSEFVIENLAKTGLLK